MREGEQMAMWTMCATYSIRLKTKPWWMRGELSARRRNGRPTLLIESMKPRAALASIETPHTEGENG